MLLRMAWLGRGARVPSLRSATREQRPALGRGVARRILVEGWPNPRRVEANNERQQRPKPSQTSQTACDAAGATQIGARLFGVQVGCGLSRAATGLSICLRDARCGNWRYEVELLQGGTLAVLSPLPCAKESLAWADGLRQNCCNKAMPGESWKHQALDCEASSSSSPSSPSASSTPARQRCLRYASQRGRVLVTSATREEYLIEAVQEIGMCSQKRTCPSRPFVVRRYFWQKRLHSHALA